MSQASRHIRFFCNQRFFQYGFVTSRQTGSHVIMVKQGFDVTLSVPLHNPIKRGKQRKKISDAGLSVDEFIMFLN